MPRLKPVKPIPPRLELLVSWLLAKQGRERPPSMRHVADEMNAVLQDTLGLEGAATDVAAESEVAILDAAADNLTPAIMADEPEMPASPVRELEEIDPGMLPQVDELRAQVVREQRARNRRRGLVIAAVLVIVTGGGRVAAAEARQRTEGGHRHAAASRRADRGRAGRGETRRRTHHQTHRAQQAHARARLARRRAVGRPGIRRRPQVARRNRRHARTPKIRRRAGAARSSSTKALDAIEARVPEALTAQITEGKRALAAGEFENARQALDTALKIDPGNQEATDWLGKVAAASGVVPTLADAENAEAAKDLPKAQTLFADVLKRNPGNVAATEGLARVKRAMADKQFNAEMGAGLAALNAGRLAGGAHASRTRAVRSVRTAAKWRPRCNVWRTPAAGAAPPSSPQRAARLASEERWTEALAIYDEALGARSLAAVRHRPAAPRWRRVRNSASGYRHS